jgi:ArsR family transcriptional regulator, arsenate/arsenite/antimonite-responsive transcriptional repressor
VRTLADLFKALADETRLQMLALLLRRGELCVCDFVQVLDVTQSKASRHLRYLLHAGLVSDRRAGVWVYYRVRRDPDEGPRAVLHAVRPVLAARDLGGLERRLDEWEGAKTDGRATCADAGAAPRPVAG